MRVLGIDTSCDDTAVGIVEAPRRVLSNTVLSQHDLHEAFGGVVPEIASRAHAERVSLVVARALADAGLVPSDLDAIAVTNRPGLIGALMVGLTAAKSLAMAWDLPLVGVHHIEAHCTAALAEHEDLDFPFVALVASGGHTACYACRAPDDIALLASTIDDAAGECFDKVAKLLGLPQPGGPSISRLAQSGDPTAVRFPRSRVKRAPLDMSFSGLKTAVLYFLKGPGGRRDQADREDLAVSHADVAASFERAVVDVLVDRALRATEAEGVSDLVLGGGVAANRSLRALAVERAPEGVRVHIPSPSLCTDNGAMIALRGAQCLAAGEADALDLDCLATGAA